jgi:hypothetical protein
MAVTCGFAIHRDISNSIIAGQTMIIWCPRGGLEPLAYITAAGADPWLSV